MKQFYLVAMAAMACVCNHVAAQKWSLNQPVTDSTSENATLYPGSRAVDADTVNTYWSSQYVFKQSLTVDLEQVRDVTNAKITWANGYYASVFDILLSNDNTHWRLAATYPANTSSTVSYIEGLSGGARYVKFQGRGRGKAGKGYQIADFSIYTTPATPAQQAEISTLTARIQGSYTQDPLTTSEITDLYNNILANGSWTDMIYTSTGNWPTHAERLYKMALAYNKPGNLYYKSTTMRDKIASGLSFLNRIRPAYTINWFEPTIGAPLNFAKALLILKNDISADSVRLYSTYLVDNTDNASHRGMNRAWVSAITIHKGCIENKYGLISKGYNSMASCLTVATGPDTEGPRIDGSFHQHHNQLQSGSYGKGFLDYFADYIKFSNGLAFDSNFTPDRKTLLRTLFLDGLRLLSYKRNVDFGTVGREVSRNLSTSLLISSPMLDTMALNDPGNAAAYQNWRDHLNLGTPLLDTSIKYFWKSSILTTRYPGFYMSAKVISTRGDGTERLNNENLKGYNLPMGATNIMRSGSEYRGIFPIWRWCRIPGTTTELSEDSARIRVDSPYVKGTNDFGGGLSQFDGGIIAYEHDYKGVKAKKAYVMMNNQMICLGAGIYGTRPNEVVTSLDQAFTNGTVSYSNGSGTQIFTGDSLTANTFTWMHHNNIGYIIPNGGLMTLLNKTQSGSWKDLRTNNSPDVITDTVFSAYFRHSPNPSNRHYSYIVAPDVPLSSMDSLYNNNGYTFPRNEADIQALRSAGQYTKYAVVFYAPGSINMGDGLTITSNQKAIVLIKEYPTNYRVSVADPIYSQGTITIKLNKQLTGAGSSYAGGVTTINFTMPTGEDAGGTKTGFYSKVSGARIALDAVEVKKDIADEEVKVYPNPATNFVELRGYNFTYGTIQVRLLDAQGRLIRNVTATTSPIHIPTTGLPSGKYYLYVEDKTKGKTTYPFLIVR
jgi:hypothetical protein